MKPGEPPDNIYPLFSGIDTTPFGATSQDQASDDGWSTTPETNVTDPAAGNNSSQRRNIASSRRNRRRRRATRLPRPAAWIALALLAGVGLASARQILQTSSTERPTHASSGRTYRAAIPPPTPTRDKQASTQPRHAPVQRLHTQRRNTTSRRARGRPHHGTHASAPTNTARYVSSGSPEPSVAAVQAAPTAGATTPTAATSSRPDTAASQVTNNPPAFGANGVLGPGHSPNG